MKEKPQKQKDEEDFGFYDGVLAGIERGNREIREGHIGWAENHKEEIEESANRGVLTAKILLEVLKKGKK